MTFVFPMAGRGQRFVDAGYTVPKFLIEVNNKTLLQYSIESLPVELADIIIFIALKEHVEQYNLAVLIKEIIGEVKFVIVVLDKVTRGQAETVLMAKNYIEKNSDLIIYNIDTYFKSNNLKSLLLSHERFDGIIGAFIDNNPKWSFALLDSKKKFVTKTTEKDPISEYALTGMYHFTKAADFLEIAEMYISNDIRIKNEFYIAPMYSDLIQRGKKFILDKVDKLIPLGTPNDVEIFQTSFR